MGLGQGGNTDGLLSMSVDLQTVRVHRRTVGVKRMLVHSSLAAAHSTQSIRTGIGPKVDHGVRW